MASPLRWAVERLGGRREPAPPLVRGIGPTLLPRRQRFYFSFGTPIDTTRWGVQDDQDAAARELRDEVRASVESQISTLLARA